MHPEQTNTAHRPSSGDFFPVLDGLRGLAVLGVVVYHTIYFNPNSPIQNLLYSFVKGGWMGVPVFFVLSGFLISHTVFKAPESFDAVAYAGRRAAKVAPPFLLSLVVFAFLSYFWLHPDNLLLSVLTQATTAAHFIKEPEFINVVSWSLFVEIHFYILLPLVYFALRRFTRFPEWMTFWCFFVIPLLIRLASHLSESTDRASWIFHANLFPRALDNFALGILFSILYLHHKKSPGLSKYAPSLAAGGVLLLCITCTLYGLLQFKYDIHDRISVLVFETFRYLPAASTFLILFSVMASPSFWLSRWLSCRALSFIGLISYEWFLFHYPPARFCASCFGSASGNLLVYLGRTLLPISGTLLLSAGIYLSLSGPILAWTKQRLKRRASSYRPVAKKAQAGGLANHANEGQTARENVPAE